MDGRSYVALPLLPQPGHVDDEQWHPGHRTKAIEELRKYRHGLKVMSGGLMISGGEPLMQHRFVAKRLKTY